MWNTVQRLLAFSILRLSSDQRLTVLEAKGRIRASPVLGIGLEAGGRTLTNPKNLSSISTVPDCDQSNIRPAP